MTVSPKPVPRKISPAPRRAITPSSEANPPPSTVANSVWTTLGALSLVVLLILVIARVFKSQSPLAGSPAAPDAIEPLGRRCLDQRHTIHLVRLGSRILILGASSDGLQMLSEVTDPAEVDELADLCRCSEADRPFDAAFRSLFRKRSSPTAGRPNGGSRGDNGGPGSEENGFPEDLDPFPPESVSPGQSRLEDAPYA